MKYLILGLLVVHGLALADEVAEFKRTFEELQRKEVETPYLEGLNELRARYSQAIETQLQKAIKEGNLDAAAALKNEKEAFALEGATAEKNPTVPALVQLRKIYKEEVARVDEERRINLSALANKMATAIMAKEKELTQAAKIDEALALREYRNELGELSIRSGHSETEERRSEERGWVKVFNGKDLAGWKAGNDSRNFRVEDSVLVVGRVGRQADYLIFQGVEGVPAMLRDFEFRAKVRADEQANSGVYFHSDGRLKGAHLANGHEVSLSSGNRSMKYPTGALYSVTEMRAPQINQQGWFDLRFRVEGKQITVWLDERVILEHEDSPSAPGWNEGKRLLASGGKLAIQCNSPGAYYFRDMEIRVLK